MKRPSYAKPQSLEDRRKYRLSDLFEFTAMPEHERAVMRWVLDNNGVSVGDATSDYRIGNEWFLQFVRFRQWYAGMERCGTFLKTIEELEAKRAAGGAR